MAQIVLQGFACRSRSLANAARSLTYSAVDGTSKLFFVVADYGNWWKVKKHTPSSERLGRITESANAYLAGSFGCDKPRLMNFDSPPVGPSRNSLSVIPRPTVIVEATATTHPANAGHTTYAFGWKPVRL